MTLQKFPDNTSSVVAENFELLVKQTEDQAFRLARLVTGSDEEAEMVLAKVYSYACEEFTEGKISEGDILSRILTQTIEAAIARVQLTKFSVERLATLSGEMVPRREVFVGVDAREHNLRRSLHELPTIEQEVFLLHDVLGLSFERIAAVLNTSRVEVQAFLYRARSFLRAVLQQGEDSQPPRAIPFVCSNHPPRYPVEKTH